eukprot:SAG22_NODE_1098_length_5567_cov_27.664045_3_plen_34_part_00
MFEFQVYYISKTNMPTYLDWLPDEAGLDKTELW